MLYQVTVPDSFNELRNKLFLMAQYSTPISYTRRRPRQYHLSSHLWTPNQAHTRLHDIFEAWIKWLCWNPSTRAELNLILQTENSSHFSPITRKSNDGPLNPVSFNKRPSILFSKYIEDNQILYLEAE